MLEKAHCVTIKGMNYNNLCVTTPGLNAPKKKNDGWLGMRKTKEGASCMQKAQR